MAVVSVSRNAARRAEAGEDVALAGDAERGFAAMADQGVADLAFEPLDRQFTLHQEAVGAVGERVLVDAAVVERGHDHERQVEIRTPRFVHEIEAGVWLQVVVGEALVDGFAREDLQRRRDRVGVMDVRRAHARALEEFAGSARRRARCPRTPGRAGVRD